MCDKTYEPVCNPVTGLEHHVMPKVTSIPVPKALLYVGNSFFFFNNGAHRFARRLLQKAPNPPKFRCNMVAINGASLSWHDVESYFRPHAISSYVINDQNEVVFRDPNEQLWDSVLLHDSSQGPIHPTMGEDFKKFAKLDAEICRKHNVFVVADEIHHDLIMPGYEHTEILNIKGYEDMLVAITAGSKTFNLAGCQNSYVILPDEKLRAEYDAFMADLRMGGGNAFGNVAVEAAFKGGREWLDEVLKIIHTNAKIIEDTFPEKLPKAVVIENGVYVGIE